MLCPERSESFNAASPAGTAEKKLPGLSVAVAASAIALLLAAALFALPGCATTNPDTDPVNKAQVGDVVQFGDYQWRVLAKEGGKALLITEDAIGTRAYNKECVDVAWENCTLRSYLNGEFYNGFDDNQKRAIAETKNSISDNPEHGTPGGGETTDKVFCLSIERKPTSTSPPTRTALPGATATPAPGGSVRLAAARNTRLTSTMTGTWIRTASTSTTPTAAFVLSCGLICNPAFLILPILENVNRQAIFCGIFQPGFGPNPSLWLSA